MFDYVIGTSTGSVLAFLLFLNRLPIDQTEQLYLELASEVFRRNNLLGIGQLFLNHAFYDAGLLERLLK